MKLLSFVTLSAGVRKRNWVRVLVIYFCFTYYPKTLRLEIAITTTKTLPYSFLESGIWERLSWVLLLRVSYEVAIKLLAGAPGIVWRLGCFEDASLTWLLAGCLCSLLGVDKRPQFLTTWAFPQDCLSIPLTWQLAMSDPRGRAGRKLQCFFWPSLPGFHHFHFILLIKSKSLSPAHT